MLSITLQGLMRGWHLRQSWSTQKMLFIAVESIFTTLYTDSAYLDDRSIRIFQSKTHHKHHIKWCQTLQSSGTRLKFCEEEDDDNNDVSKWHKSGRKIHVKFISLHQMHLWILRHYTATASLEYLFKIIRMLTMCWLAILLLF